MTLWQCVWYTVPMKLPIKPRMLCWILSVCALTAGAEIYVLASAYEGGTVFLFVRNFGADFLWALSLEFALAPFVKEIFPRKYPTVLAAVCMCVGCLFEYLQAKGICKGTGDFWDCAVYLTASVLGCSIIKKLYAEREKK